MTAKDTEDAILEAAERARAGVRRGERPSEVVREIISFLESRRGGWNMVVLVVIGKEAFGLTISECKQAPGWSGHRLSDPAALDDYLSPLIERNRLIWDRACRTTEPGDR